VSGNSSAKITRFSHHSRTGNARQPSPCAQGTPRHLIRSLGSGDPTTRRLLEEILAV
jgi:hypothetical protein